MATKLIFQRLLVLGWEDALAVTIISSIYFVWTLQTYQGASMKQFNKGLEWKPQSALTSTVHDYVSPRSANICELLPSLGPSAVVFWGSQGGTAEIFASRFASELSSRFSVESITADLDDYNHIHLGNIPKHVPVVFVLATYGEGDPTDNANAFLKHLRARKAKNLRLDNLQFAIFGLGNSNYQHYNKVAKDVNQMLTELGAQRVGPFGLGNDAKGKTEEDFIRWKTSSIRDLADTFGFTEAASMYKPRIEIRPLQGLLSLNNVYQGEPHKSYLAVSTSIAQRISTAPLVLPVADAYELSQKDIRNFLHLEFSLDEFPSVQYESGDYLKIWPVNPENEVASFLRLLGLWDKRQDVISITPRTGFLQSKSNLPTPTTIESLFRYYLDICGPVSRDFLLGLSEFLPQTAFNQQFEELCRDHDRFRNEVILRRLKPKEALEKVSEYCPEIPLSYVVEHLKKLQPRSYSISSSSVVQPRRVAITALVLKEQILETSQSCVTTPRMFEGVTTNYLLRLKQEWCSDGRRDISASPNYLLTGPREVLKPTKIFAQIHPSKFKLPKEHNTPIVMVGAGSGVAPFRAFVQERTMLKKRGECVGRTILFVGHRNPDEDFIYRKEWQAAQNILGDRFRLYTAFSRWCQAPKRYVQDVLKENIGLVLEILADDAQGAMYICGSSAMATSVTANVKEGWTRLTAGNVGNIDSDMWLQSRKRAGRLFEDSW